jgi:hypothetical protein
MNQLSIDFDRDITKAYSSCRAYVENRVHHQGRSQKSIAADMDYSPSQLSNKLAQGDGTSARFTLDDLELFMQVTGDIEPVKYLVAKYLYRQAPEEIERQIEALQKKLAEVKHQ